MIAVLGCGSIGRRHITNMIGLGVPAENIIAWDVFPNDRGCPAVERLGVRYQSVHRYSVHWLEYADAVLICSPAEHHAECLRAVLDTEHRIPFFVEKPCVSRSSDVTPAMLAASDTLPHMVGFNWRFNREYLALKACASTDCGIDLRCATDMATWPGTYGDPLLECSHEIDLALYWLRGQPEITYTHRGRSQARVHLAVGARVACVDIAWAYEPHREARLIDPSKAIWICEPSQESIDASYVAELQEFLGLVRGDVTLRRGATLREAVEVVKICEHVSQPKVAA